MSLDYDNNNESSWKHNPSSVEDTNFANNNYASGDGASPSFRYNATDDYGGRTEIVTGNANFAGDYDGACAGGCNPFFHGGIVDNSNNAPVINPVEEESQVVPVSLDHLSRDELCRMIYRLDYERNTLRDQLEALRSNQLSLKTPTTRKGKKRKPAKSPSPGGLDVTHAKKTSPFHSRDIGNQQLQARQAPENSVDTMPAPPPPTPLEVEKVQKRLGQKITFAVKQSAVHGLRKIPKSTITEGLTLPMMMAIMQNHDDKKTSDTKRMIKWNLTDDRDIAKLLRVERLIHPVNHDGSGHIFLSPSSNPSNVYHWAKFTSVEARYDKRETLLTLIAKTMDAGSGRPENVPEKLKFSRGETED